MTALQDSVAQLTQQVKYDADVESSAITALNSQLATIQAAVDTGSIQAVNDAVATLKTNSAALAAAVANTTPQPAGELASTGTGTAPNLSAPATVTGADDPTAVTQGTGAVPQNQSTGI